MAAAAEQFQLGACASPGLCGALGGPIPPGGSPRRTCRGSATMTPLEPLARVTEDAWPPPPPPPLGHSATEPGGMRERSEMGLGGVAGGVGVGGGGGAPPPALDPAHWQDARSLEPEVRGLELEGRSLEGRCSPLPGGMGMPKRASETATLDQQSIAAAYPSPLVRAQTISCGSSVCSSGGGGGGGGMSLEGLSNNASASSLVAGSGGGGGGGGSSVRSSSQLQRKAAELQQRRHKLDQLEERFERQYGDLNLAAQALSKAKGEQENTQPQPTPNDKVGLAAAVAGREAAAGGGMFGRSSPAPAQHPGNLSPISASRGLPQPHERSPQVGASAGPCGAGVPAPASVGALASDPLNRSPMMGSAPPVSVPGMKHHQLPQQLRQLPPPPGDQLRMSQRSGELRFQRKRSLQYGGAGGGGGGGAGAGHSASLGGIPAAAAPADSNGGGPLPTGGHGAGCGGGAIDAAAFFGHSPLPWPPSAATDVGGAAGLGDVAPGRAQCAAAAAPSFAPPFAPAAAAPSSEVVPLSALRIDAGLATECGLLEAAEMAAAQHGCGSGGATPLDSIGMGGAHHGRSSPGTQKLLSRCAQQYGAAVSVLDNTSPEPRERGGSLPYGGGGGYGGFGGYYAPAAAAGAPGAARWDPNASPLASPPDGAPLAVAPWHSGGGGRSNNLSPIPPDDTPLMESPVSRAADVEVAKALAAAVAADGEEEDEFGDVVSAVPAAAHQQHAAADGGHPAPKLTLPPSVLASSGRVAVADNDDDVAAASTGTHAAQVQLARAAADELRELREQTQESESGSVVAAREYLSANLYPLNTDDDQPPADQPLERLDLFGQQLPTTFGMSCAGGAGGGVVGVDSGAALPLRPGVLQGGDPEYFSEDDEVLTSVGGEDDLLSSCGSSGTRPDTGSLSHSHTPRPASRELRGSGFSSAGQRSGSGSQSARAASSGSAGRVASGGSTRQQQLRGAPHATSPHKPSSRERGGAAAASTSTAPPAAAASTAAAAATANGAAGGTGGGLDVAQEARLAACGRSGDYDPLAYTDAPAPAPAGTVGGSGGDEGDEFGDGANGGVAVATGADEADRSAPSGGGGGGGGGGGTSTSSNVAAVVLKAEASFDDAESSGGGGDGGGACGGGGSGACGGGACGGGACGGLGGTFLSNSTCVPYGERLFTPPVIPPGMRMPPDLGMAQSWSHASPPRALIVSEKRRKSSTATQPRDQQPTADGSDPAPPGEAEDSLEVSNDDLDLLYDPILNCYYDPKTNKYYELAA